MSPETIGSLNANAVVSLSCRSNRIALLPDSFFNMPLMYTNGENVTTPFGLVARSPKPEQRDRLSATHRIQTLEVAALQT